MITVEDIQRLLGADTPVVAEDGSTIGAMGEVFLDTVSGEPAWVTVHTGLFGRAQSFVPLTGAVTRGDAIHVPYGKDAVKHAPRPGAADGRLTPDEERDLYRHYGLLHDDEPAADGDRTHAEGDRDRLGTGAAPDEEDRTGVLRYAGPVPSPQPAPPAGDLAAAGPVPDELAGDATAGDATAGDATAGDATAVGETGTGTDAAEPADGSMVRAEERLRVVGTERVPTERVRMRRYTVTEEKTITVPVRRERFRLEYDPAEPGAEAEVLDDVTATDAQPRRDVPDGTAPGDAAPGDAAPGDAAPGDAAPGRPAHDRP